MGGGRVFTSQRKTRLKIRIISEKKEGVRWQEAKKAEGGGRRQRKKRQAGGKGGRGKVGTMREKEVEGTGGMR